MPPAIECRPRYATARTVDRDTLGRAAARVARVLGQPLLPWQRDFLDVLLEVDADGRLVFSDATLSVMRQQGKTYTQLVYMCTRALLSPGLRIVYAAQSALDGRRKMTDDWLPLIQASPLGGQVTAYLAPGRESLRFANGSMVQLIPSTAKATHGQVIDVGVVDEAFSFTDGRLEQTIRPAMMTRPEPQFVVCSTAGVPGVSSWLHERVITGRQAVEAGLNRSLCFCEYAAEDDADPAAEATWLGSMPALNASVSVEAVRSAQRSMPRGEFARAYLNRWVAVTGESVVDIEHWQSLAEPDAPRPSWCVLAADVAPKGKSAAIVACGEDGDLLRVAVLEHGPGSDWVAPALARLRGELGNPRVIVDAKGCSAILPAVERAADFEVTALGAGDVPVACEFFLKLTQESRLRHRGEKELLIALDGASTRQLGDGFAFSRRNSSVDISPLVAAVNAVSFWHGSWGAL